MGAGVSAWGDSWARAWGVSWGAVQAVVAVVTPVTPITYWDVQLAPAQRKKKRPDYALLLLG